MIEFGFSVLSYFAAPFINSFILLCDTFIKLVTVQYYALAGQEESRNKRRAQQAAAIFFPCIHKKVFERRGNMSSQNVTTASGGTRKRKRLNAEETLSFRIDPPRGDCEEFRQSLRRLFDTKQLCDIHFNVRGKKFSAHRVVLAASNR
jgi:hypothetical protein